ncbi:hypothetical protein GCM10029992_04570 [Glycomyces albus]
MTEHQGPGGCGCADWRTDTDLETEFQDDVSNVFPLGLYPEEHAPKLKDDLDQAAEQAETTAVWAAAKAARAKARARFTTEAPEAAAATEPEPDPGPENRSASAPARAATATGSDLGPPPFLSSPSREAPAAGASTHTMLQPEPPRGRAHRHARTRHTTPSLHTPHRRRPFEPPPAHDPGHTSRTPLSNQPSAAARAGPDLIPDRRLQPGLRCRRSRGLAECGGVSLRPLGEGAGRVAGEVFDVGVDGPLRLVR